MSYRDYWSVKFDSGLVLLISRDSESGVVLASVAGSAPPWPDPIEVHYNPDDIVVGSVMESANGTQATVVSVTKIPKLAVTR